MSELRRKVNIVKDAFVDELLSEGENKHPLRTGLTRANWNPSINAKDLSTSNYGLSEDDIKNFSTGTPPLLPLSVALGHSKKHLDYKIGDTIYFTNSVKWIGSLEQRRMFFDRIVENAKQAAQVAVRADRNKK